MTETGTVPIQVAGSHGVRDYEIALSDRDVTLAEVFSALQLPAIGTAVDGRVPRHPESTRAVEVLSSGCQLASPEHLGFDGPISAGGLPLVEVALVGGLDAGAITQLPAGRYRVGQRQADGRSGWYLAVEDTELASTEPRPWHEHGPSVEALDFDGAVLALGKPVDAEAGYQGYVHRPPRPMPPAGVEPIEVVAPPNPVAEPQPLSWATLLAPIPIALLMAFFFRPLFAIFAAMGPVVALGRWFESRRRFRRETRKRDAAIALLQSGVVNDIRLQSEAEARLRWQNNPHVAELWRRARTASVRLWERRPGTQGYLSVTVGIGTDEIAAITDGGKTSPEIHGPLHDPVAVRAVPHVVDLAHHSGVGIHGRREEALALARSLILQLATLHGPADLRVGLVCSPEVSVDWDWLKWLPHLARSLLADGAAQIVKELVPVPGPASVSFGKRDDVDEARLIIVDGSNVDVAAIHRAALDADTSVRFIAIADHPTLLPPLVRASSPCVAQAQKYRPLS